jgi:hypothetical protein
MNGRDHLVDLGVNGKIILKLFLIKPVVKIITGFRWFRIGSSS